MNAQSKQSEQVATIRRYSRELMRELQVLKGVFLGSGYTFSQCHVLFEISQASPLTLGELATTLLIDKGNVSRTVKKLVADGLVEVQAGTTDQRQRLFRLTAAGKKALASVTNVANQQVSQAMALLSESEQELVSEGLRVYGRALQRIRLQEGFEIRSIQKGDNPHVARLIREVMQEFDAVGPGYSIGDPEVDRMYETYRPRNACYLVIVQEDAIVGGGGIGPLAGGDSETCELQKMFFRPETRGRGLGHRLLNRLLDEARKRDYRQCYLETLDRMWRANELYLRNGFQRLEQPQGDTGHCQCDRWYSRSL